MHLIARDALDPADVVDMTAASTVSEERNKLQAELKILEQKMTGCLKELGLNQK